jgi:exodeoxyribonuclease V gamma subunit
MRASLQPGLLVLHGNRAELLADALVEWLRRHPLAPLEEEIVLVQSNGIAEWLKMLLAAQTGICAATRVELPGRFLWRAYRQVLGRGAVPAQSPLDKLPLAWRLMALLPELLPRPGFEPLAGFLRGGGLERRLQLAQRLADLYDQYQVYRADWLAAWEGGRDVLPRQPDDADAPPLPPDQRWQALLWRELLAGAAGAPTRGQLHQRFVAALQAPGAAPAVQKFQATPSVPRRIVLFGMTHLPWQTLQALAALSQHSQVLLAVPNPCRWHWADIIDGRELLRMQRRRLPLRAGRDLAAVALEDMHQHAHPLLAAWGRQGRDFVRQLDAFDDALAAQQRFAVARVDLFDEGPGQTLLQQVQASIRDLVPLHEHPRPPVPASDRSIVFHIAHSAQREVEILHDQLLALLGAQPGLQPRDIVVMVPDIELFAPAIRSVFGQLPRSDARFIPYDIADLQERGHNPLVVALEWLLRLPQQRVRASELRDLLEVPAVAARFGIAPADLPQLAQWVQGAGIRWGLDVAQRESLGLGACGEQNTWAFGLRRMLLGYASGEAGQALGEIEPYAEIGGLDAALAGALAALVLAVSDWWAQGRDSLPPAAWAERLRALLAALFKPADERERLTLAALQDALRAWLEACDTAGFDQPVPLAVAREAWLAGLAEPGLGRRFRAGGVTFCTLLPMRAIPFEVVCLLGMNDGDYPRSAARSDFDLLRLPGQARPGDRARRDDDRQLMLEALLSARRVLYVSWAGRSVRDHSEQPPSVLVSQLRDYLAAGWSAELLSPRTTEHPLQPFSRRYFEADPVEAHPVKADPAPPLHGERLFTQALEWRAAYTAAAVPAAAAVPPFTPDPAVPLTLAVLTRFLKNPVKEHFRSRLDVVFAPEDVGADDDETLALDGLESYTLHDEVLRAVQSAVQAQPGLRADLAREVENEVARVQRSGRLPLAEQGRRVQQDLVATLTPTLQAWYALRESCPLPVPPLALHIGQGGMQLRDGLDDLRQGADGATCAFELQAGRLCSGPKFLPILSKLVPAWVRALVAGACGHALHGVLVGRDATLTLPPVAPEAARDGLSALLAAWREGMDAPLPLACRTALAQVAGVADLAPFYEGSDRAPGEVAEPCLARCWPDLEALLADGRFTRLALALYGPLHGWAQGAQVQPHAEAGHG